MSSSKMPESRFVDVERALHRFRRQSDLVALDGAPRRDLHLDPGLLDRIGILDGDAGMLQRQLPDLRAGLFRLVELFGSAADFVFGKCHGMSKERGCREMINMLSVFGQPDSLLAAAQK
jgi:hypothetical protein